MAVSLCVITMFRNLFILVLAVIMDMMETRIIDAQIGQNLKNNRGSPRVLGDRRHGLKMWRQTIFKAPTSDRDYQENRDNLRQQQTDAA